MKPSLIIVGLGNPGASYGETRHNVGFRAVDLLARTWGGGKWVKKQRFLSMVQTGSIGEIAVLFVKPQTYVNRSGEAVKKLVDFYRCDPTFQLLVICDDADVPLGKVRFRAKGGPGTHNGLKSLVEHVGEGFPRLRVGLGAPPAGADLATWVLSAPSAEDAPILREALKDVVDQVDRFVRGARGA
jgi:PTH1 family peptidyl-tRNA hydrolase